MKNVLTKNMHKENAFLKREEGTTVEPDMVSPPTFSDAGSGV
jgi:hypothetical protein